MGARRTSGTERRRAFLIGLAAAAGLVVAAPFALRDTRELPPLDGRLVYVSDRAGRPLLYLRDLATGEERRLTALPEGSTDPAPSPDGRRVAFATRGRIATVDLDEGRIAMLTLGTEFVDGQPSWLPSGEGLVVVSRPREPRPADLHLLYPGPTAAEVRREALTRTPGLEESAPAVAPDGTVVAFVRGDQIHLLDLASRTERRATAGFRRRGAPRYASDGALLFPFTDDKQAGIERLAPGAAAPETLVAESARYAVVAPLRDGRHLVGEFLYDTGAPLSDVLRLGGGGELWLLDARGRPLGTLVRSWRHGFASPAAVP